MQESDVAMEQDQVEKKQPLFGRSWGGTRPHRWNAESDEDWAVIARRRDDIRSSPTPNATRGVLFELNEVCEFQHRPSIGLAMGGRFEITGSSPSFLGSLHWGKGHRMLIYKGNLPLVGPRIFAGADFGHFFRAQDNDWLS
jgi:hypothetical protein